jgi:hypothetical protein
MEKEKLHYGIFGRYPSAILHQSISFTRFLMDNLRKVRGIAEKPSSCRFTRYGTPVCHDYAGAE